MMRGAFAFAWAEEDEKSKNGAPKFNIMKVTIMLRTHQAPHAYVNQISLTTGIYNFRKWPTMTRCPVILEAIIIKPEDIIIALEVTVRRYS